MKLRYHVIIYCVQNFLFRNKALLKVALGNCFTSLSHGSFLRIKRLKSAFAEESMKHVTGYFRATTIERRRIIRNLSLLVFHSSEERKRVLKGFWPDGWADRKGYGRGSVVAPEVADRLEEDERARFKEASIKNNNVITF